MGTYCEYNSLAKMVTKSSRPAHLYLVLSTRLTVGKPKLIILLYSYSGFLSTRCLVNRCKGL